MIFKNKRKILLLSILLALIILLIPYTVNLITNNDSFIGEQSYFSERMVRQYEDAGIQSTDLLTGEPQSFNAFFYIISLFGVEISLIVNFLPVILGLLTITFLYLLLTELNLKPDSILFALIVFLLSPIFIYTFTVFVSEAFAVCLLILSLYLFVKNNYLSALPLIFVLLSNFIIGFAGIILMLGHFLYRRRTLRVLISNFVVSIIVIIFGTLFLKFNLLLNLAGFSAKSSVLFVSFGGTNAYSLIMITLALIGFSVAWKRNLSWTFLYSLTFILFIFSVFYPELRILVSIILSVFSGIAVSGLITKKWNVSKLKTITLLLIIYILIFSAAVFLKNNIQQVSYEKVNAISYLSATDKNDIILSSEENGFLIESISGRKAFLDSNSYKSKNYAEKIEVANSIYYSRNLDTLKTILREHNINHILVDEKMISGGVWDSADEGILFLFENSDSFVKLFDNKKVQIYRFLDDNF